MLHLGEVSEICTRKFEKSGNLNTDTENFSLTSVCAWYMDSRWYTPLIFEHLSNRGLKVCILAYENCVSSVWGREITFLFTSESVAYRLPFKCAPERWKSLHPMLPTTLAWLRRCCWEVQDRPPCSRHLASSDFLRKQNVFTKTNYLLQY